LVSRINSMNPAGKLANHGKFPGPGCTLHRTEPDQAPVIAPLPERLLHHAETILIEDSSYAVTA
jgi:hypothetical protein